MSGKMCGTASSAVILLAATLTLLPKAVDGATLHNRRNVESEGNLGEVKSCESGVPCGWAMFNNLSRKVDYFIENNCHCENKMQCRITEINTYLRAYVYRCMQVGP